MERAGGLHIGHRSQRPTFEVHGVMCDVQGSREVIEWNEQSHTTRATCGHDLTPPSYQSPPKIKAKPLKKTVDNDRARITK